MPAPDDLHTAVADLSAASGYRFTVSSDVVPGTNLYLVHATDHVFPQHYSLDKGVLGFRVPGNYPEANPEDCFFLMPASVRLREADPVRNSIELNRAAPNADFAAGLIPGGGEALVVSWHLWNRRPWDRRKHTLIDHYWHCLRRFDQPEHD